MTPNNILNMSMLNGLDFIAITDHNSTKQLKIIEELSESYDFIVIPGVEVSVKEGFDVLCYFKTFEIAKAFNNFLEDNLTDNWGNYTDGDQIITDIYDMSLETYKKPLTDTTIMYEDLVKEVRKHDGLIVLAHINRPSCTPLSVYKLEDLEFDGVEIPAYMKEDYINENKHLLQYRILTNSDSHTLLQIFEKDSSFELEEKSIDAFFNYMKG